MKSVVICCSRRFKKEERRFAASLRKMDVVVYEPFLNENRKIDTLPNDLKTYAFLGLTHHHLSCIRKADVVYIYNQGGYMGNSGTLELGFAEALGKPIYAFSEDKKENCRNVLFNEIIKTPRELIKRLK
jgi:nucleoside 2-deoxyribosyltransferase